jgi:zinc protease
MSPRLRAPLFAALLLPLCLAAASRAADDRLLPFDAATKTLPNGLVVIVVPTGFPNIVSLQIPVQTGSRNEVEPGKSGFAHFFEHVMFRGTKLYPPEKYQEVITRAGAHQNAYTTDDYTNYHITFAKEDLETLLKIEADRFQNLSYPEDTFKTESRAVLGEYNKNSANPIQKLFETMQEHAFTVHTYKHTTMGFIKDIEDMPNQYAYSKTFFDRWYRPEYTTVIVAGDVKPAEVFPLVEKYWGAWKHGSFRSEIPQEPESKAPVTAHVAWTTPTLPWVALAFHGPAFSETEKDYAALDLLFDLTFGPTSDLYKRLVEKEQKVDRLQAGGPENVDPSLFTILARVKKGEDVPYVRDEILRAVAKVRAEGVPEARLAEAKKNARYSLARTLDNTESIAGTLARYVRYRRPYDTLNAYFQTYGSVTPADLSAAAARYLTDARLVQTTLSKDPLPAATETVPPLASLEKKGGPATGVAVLSQKSPLPQLSAKLVFLAGSAHDPKGKEGLASLAADMIAEAGSTEQTVDEIRKVLFPIAGAFTARADKEMTTFTLSIHRDNWRPFFDAVLPQLLSPGFRGEDFRRIKDDHLNALKQDLRANNEEELGKERLQTNVFAGTAYGHPALGTIAGLESITLDDVKAFLRGALTRANLTVGIAGDAPEEMTDRLYAALASLPAGPALPKVAVAGRRPKGMEVEIIEKETRATAISFGLPIDVTRTSPDFAALSVARAWLGEHRSSMGRLYQRIREVRGMNYGDYAYIEAFPRGMYQFFPSPNNARQAQLFEVWIRPVVPANGHMALRLGIHELEKMIDKGMSKADFESTRGYLMKNVFLLTATQQQQLGTALDQKWYGAGEYTATMREQLGKLTLADVNKAIRKHLSAKDLSVVVITKDANGFKEALVSDAPSPIKYDSPKPADVMAEDKVISTKQLGVKAENVKITAVDEVFAK